MLYHTLTANGTEIKKAPLTLLEFLKDHTVSKVNMGIKMTSHCGSWCKRSPVQCCVRTEGKPYGNQEEPRTENVARSSGSSLRYRTHQH